MKLINYESGYNMIFECIIHGTIKMTKSEFDQAVRYLLNSKDWIDEENYSRFYKTILKEDLNRRIYKKDKKGNVVKFLTHLRVQPTKGIAKRFNLENYKKGNYQIEVQIDK